MIDEGFIYRTYRTSVVVWIIAVLACLAYRLWFVALGFSVGAIVSFVILASLDHIVRQIFVPGASNVKPRMIRFGIVKLLVIGAITIGVVLTQRFDLILGFCAGIALTQFVMFLKVVGIILRERIGQ